MIVQMFGYSYIFEVKCFLLWCCWNSGLMFSQSIGRGMLIPKPGTLFSIEKKCKVTQKSELACSAKEITFLCRRYAIQSTNTLKLNCSVHAKSRSKFCVCEHVHAHRDMGQQMGQSDLLPTCLLTRSVMRRKY